MLRKKTQKTKKMRKKSRENLPEISSFPQQNREYFILFFDQNLSQPLGEKEHLCSFLSFLNDEILREKDLCPREKKRKKLKKCKKCKKLKKLKKRKKCKNFNFCMILKISTGSSSWNKGTLTTISLCV